MTTCDLLSDMSVCPETVHRPQSAQHSCSKPKQLQPHGNLNWARTTTWQVRWITLGGPLILIIAWTSTIVAQHHSKYPLLHFHHTSHFYKLVQGALVRRFLFWFQARPQSSTLQNALPHLCPSFSCKNHFLLVHLRLYIQLL